MEIESLIHLDNQILVITQRQINTFPIFLAKILHFQILFYRVATGNNFNFIFPVI